MAQKQTLLAGIDTFFEAGREEREGGQQYGYIQVPTFITKQKYVITFKSHIYICIQNHTKVKSKQENECNLYSTHTFQIYHFYISHLSPVYQLYVP